MKEDIFIISPANGTEFKECPICTNPFICDGKFDNCIWCELQKEPWNTARLRNLETKCKDCGRLVYEKTFGDKWISVKDRLPNIDQRVLVYQKDGVHGGHLIDIEYLLCDGFWKDQGMVSGITHWMPLPKPPKD